MDASHSLHGCDMRKVQNTSALLRFRIAATCHVEAFLRRRLGYAIDTVRAAACYDLSMLALGYHDRLSAHAAAMTAARQRRARISSPHRLCCGAP